MIVIKRRILYDEGNKMARPTQNTIDYFSHDCNHKQTMYILESKYKNDGYAFWFKLLESLGSAPNHFLDLNDEIACEFLAAKTNLNWSSCDEILTLLAKINAICPDLWAKKIVWCQKFVDRMAAVYAKRKKELPSKPSFCDGNDSIPVISVTETPQSKVNESKLNESRIKHVAKNCDVSVKTAKSVNKVEIPDKLNTPEFLAAWEEWQLYRKQRRKTLTDVSIKKQLEFLASIGVQDAVTSINESIKNGYTGLFKVKQATRNDNDNGGGFDAIDWLKNA